MIKKLNLFHLIPRRYRHYLSLIFFICLLIILIYLHDSSPTSELTPMKVNITNTTNDDMKNISTNFDLYNDDDMPLLCPSEIQFNISNRLHLAIIIAPKLMSFIWKNFLSLLCTGVDVYVMLDEPFYINSTKRKDNFNARTDRSIRSYTHRFVYIPNRKLAKYGVIYMSKFPRIKYTSWDRAIVWLYHRRYLKHVWLFDYSVQWFHVDNMTYLFDFYASDKTDILSADVIATNSPYWSQWPRTKSDIIPSSYYMGTYSPLVRWSRRLLYHHYQYMQLIHTDRLTYEFDQDFRFREVIMATVANLEKLSVGLYNRKLDFTEITLSNFNDTQILNLIQNGKLIINSIIHDSILTKYRTEEIVEMMNRNSINITQHNSTKKP